MNQRRRAEVVVVECYGEQRVYRSRKVAMDFFLEAMMNSDGAEHERYETIYFQLAQGKTDVSDRIDWRG